MLNLSPEILTQRASKPIEVTQENSCPHCSKPDWCYSLGELSVCNRDCPPAPGWRKTNKTDKNGHYYYAPPQKNEKSPRPAQKRHWIYYSRTGEPLVKVMRIDKGDNSPPIRWQEYWLCETALTAFRSQENWVKLSPKDLKQGKCTQEQYSLFQSAKNKLRSQIPLYRYQEVQKAIAAGQTIFIAEGEPCVDALWKLGIPATTNIGGAGKWKPSDSNDLKEAIKLVLCPDRDVPGVRHMEKIFSDFPQAQWLYAFPNSPFWYNLPRSQGLDLADWISDYQLKAPDIWEAIEPQRAELPNPNIPTTTPPIQKKYTEMCVEELYSDKPWKTINGKLHYWTGTHYQKADEAGEKKRIADWCSRTPVQKGKILISDYADAAHVEKIWKWAIIDKSEPNPEINPPGINCLNGVVQIEWHNRRATYKLVPHHPDLIYTYVSEIEFNPDADATDCHRMLSCLEPQQQKLFLQTMAASLDLGTLRKYKGRQVKALLCKGEGNNGKDTLREAVNFIYGGIGIADASISDFAAYDRGRKFDLAKLKGSRINWSSENSSFEALDRLQSLKKAITGENLDYERKGVDGSAMNLEAVFLFNVNEVPNLKAGMEAIQSRWAVLEFNKTYKNGADPAKGEIEADSRFRYDPEFIKKQVCPALLNKMLDALSNLVIEGIDYSCTQSALENIQQETNHLWSFAKEIGLDYQRESKVYVKDLWELLQNWYIENGTLEIIVNDNGREKKLWHEQPRRGDKNVKAPNQIYQRFAELFPQIKRKKETEDQERRGQSYLTDICISPQIERQLRGNNEATNEAVIQRQKANESNEAKEPTLEEISLALKNLTPEALTSFSKLLNEQTKQVLLGVNEGQISSSDSFPKQQSNTASLTDSLTDSLIDSLPSDSQEFEPEKDNLSPQIKDPDSEINSLDNNQKEGTEEIEEKVTKVEAIFPQTGQKSSSLAEIMREILDYAEVAQNMVSASEFLLEVLRDYPLNQIKSQLDQYKLKGKVKAIMDLVWTSLNSTK